MFRNVLVVLMVCISLVLVAGCGGKTVARVATDSTMDLSGKWNDTDSRLVSEEMIRDVLSRPWLNRFVGANGGKLPVVIIGSVRNRSHEHINVQTFTKDLERSLTNSGEVEFVASAMEREELRAERTDQMMNASEATTSEQGMETGANFMLQGAINTIEDREGGQRVMFYQINLELIDLQSNKKVWIGEKKIKKFIEQSRFGM
jgi:hypothetical protein